MLGSITPLGERARGRTWGWTVAGLLVGGGVGGAVLGFAAGALGSVVRLVANVGPEPRVFALAAVVAVAAAVDARGVRLPTLDRQVNEDWLHIYRGWIYGLGFGFQLGAGVLTIVTTAAIYATVAAAALANSLAAAVAIGVVFGVVRNATVLLGALARTPTAAMALGGAVERWEQPAARATSVALALLAVAAIAAGVAL